MGGGLTVSEDDFGDVDGSAVGQRVMTLPRPVLLGITC